MKYQTVRKYNPSVEELKNLNDQGFHLAGIAILGAAEYVYFEREIPEKVEYEIEIVAITNLTKIAALGKQGFQVVGSVQAGTYNDDLAIMASVIMQREVHKPL